MKSKRIASVSIRDLTILGLFLGAITGVIVGLLYFVIFTINSASIILGLTTFCLAVVGYSLLTAAFMGIYTWIYNKYAKRTGGIRIDIR